MTTSYQVNGDQVNCGTREYPLGEAREGTLGHKVNDIVREGTLGYKVQGQELIQRFKIKSV